MVDIVGLESVPTATLRVAAIFIITKHNKKLKKNLINMKNMQVSYQK